MEANILKSKVERGDIYYASLYGAIGSEQAGRRPVIIVQNDIGNENANTIIVLPITKKIDRKVKLPTHIYLKRSFGLKIKSTILTEQIRTIDKRRLGDFIGHIDDEKLIKAIDNALIIALGIKK